MIASEAVFIEYQRGYVLSPCHSTLTPFLSSVLNHAGHVKTRLILYNFGGNKRTERTCILLLAYRLMGNHWRRRAR